MSSSSASAPKQISPGAEPVQKVVGSNGSVGPSAPCYYHWREMYPEMQLLIDNIEVIKQEAAAIGQVGSVYRCFGVCVYADIPTSPCLRHSHTLSLPRIHTHTHTHIHTHTHTQWVAWPEDHFSLPSASAADEEQQWTVFPLLHTFPGRCLKPSPNTVF
jgi:hypothetical protein